MTVLVLALAALTAAAGVSLATARLTRAEAAAPDARGWHRAARAVVAIGGATVLALLALVARGRPQGLDASAAAWSARHATASTTRALQAITDVGQPSVVVVLAVVLALAETARTRRGWAAAFLLAVVAGNAALSFTIKHAVGRARPTFDPAAAALGPAFTSGHSSWSAAFSAAAALLLACGLARRHRTVLAGAAAGVAVAVAASRVLLDLHWLSDVVGGLAQGWAWFAACALCFARKLTPAPSGQRRPRRARR